MKKIRKKYEAFNTFILEINHANRLLIVQIFNQSAIHSNFQIFHLYSVRIRLCVCALHKHKVF